MSAESRPNILYIMTDQQRFDFMSLYGLSACRTPRLDALANEGARFDRAYTVCSLCSPARASMLTGRFPHSHRMWNNNDMMQWAVRDLPDDVELISRPLNEAGYRCGYMGKWHCGEAKVPTTYGFEGMDVPNYGNPYATAQYAEYLKRTGLTKPERRPAIMDCSPVQSPIAGELVGDIRASSTWFLTDYAIDRLEGLEDQRRSDGRPWMLFASYWLPHHPYFPPTEYLEQYDVDEIALWSNFHDDLAGKPPNQKRYRESFHRAQEHDEDTWREIIRHCFAQMTFLDAQIGRLLDALAATGADRDTVVLFSTDHGDMCGSHGKFHDKDSFMYEELYHIPLLIRRPGVIEPGTVRDEFVYNMDLATTALDVARARIPEANQGRSLMPLLQSDADWPDDIYAEYFGHRFLSSNRMVRWADYKYVFNPISFDELYDLGADPGEMTNLIDDPAYAEIAAEGRRRILRWVNETGDDIRHAAQQMLS